MSNSIEEILPLVAAFEPNGAPVISVYLNTQADDKGRTNVLPFLKRELAEAIKGFPEPKQTEAAQADCDRVLAYIESDLKPETNTLVLFACAEAGLFEALQLDLTGTENRAFATWRPQLYPLLLMQNTAPRCAVVQIDRRNARILVIGEGGVMDQAQLKGNRVSHTKAGGWSQARYQRHVKEISDAHLKEVVQHLSDLCQADRIESIVLAGDDIIVPQFQALLPTDLAAKVIDTMRVDHTAAETDLVARAREALQSHDAETDKSTVEALSDAAGANGLGVIGPKETGDALKRGQVSELVMSCSVREQRPGQAEAFARWALESGAKITFLEDPGLLADSEGVGALLRYRLEPAAITT